jgi:hypothetical protein
VPSTSRPQGTDTQHRPVRRPQPGAEAGSQAPGTSPGFRLLILEDEDWDAQLAAAEQSVRLTREMLAVARSRMTDETGQA